MNKRKSSKDVQSFVYYIKLFKSFVILSKGTVSYTDKI
jgi:hypothetical protein